MAEYTFQTDEELMTKLPLANYYSVVDGRIVSSGSCNFDGGFICAISDCIKYSHIEMIKREADRAGVDFAFREPLTACNKQVLIARTDRYSDDLNKKETISDELTHHHLMATMQLRLDDIVVAREKLEAIGLLKTFYKEDNVNNYVYVLYSPLSVNEFFNHPLLSVVLYNNLGNSDTLNSQVIGENSINVEMKFVQKKLKKKKKI